jgi:hypothetical protein
MPSIRSLPSRARRLLAHHLSRLADNLEMLTSRLRDALASAVGQSVGDATREAIRAALAALTDRESADRHCQPYDRDDPFWHEPGESPWTDSEPDHWAADEQEAIPSPSRHSNRDPPQRVRWRRTIAAGLETAAWCLRRCTGPFAVLTAVGLGLVAAVALWFSPPASVAAVLVAAGLGLTRLLEVTRTTAAALDTFETD